MLPSGRTVLRNWKVERCPLQWQLIHSRYGDLEGFPTRPNPAAVEGEIVHALIERLFRRLALAGFPEPGSAWVAIERIQPATGCVKRYTHTLGLRVSRSAETMRWLSIGRRMSMEARKLVPALTPAESIHHLISQCLRFRRLTS